MSSIGADRPATPELRSARGVQITTCPENGASWGRRFRFRANGQVRPTSALIRRKEDAGMGREVLAQLDALWSGLWGTSFRPFSLVRDLANSYLTHLNSHTVELLRVLSQVDLPESDLHPALDYISWVTLGVNLVEGYHLRAKLNSAQLTAVSATVRMLVAGGWGPNILLPLRDQLSKSLEQRATSEEFGRVHQQLRHMIPTQTVEPALADAYLLGVAIGKEQWQNCTETVQTIMTRSIQDFYRNRIQEAIVEQGVTEGVTPDVLQEWLETEQRLRERFHWSMTGVS